MPSKTFLNLSLNKQNALLNAAYKEFSRVTLNEASINRIIKDANISRGSFYMYFDNIEDIYYYLLEQSRIQFLKEANVIFTKVNGDLINGFEEVFKYLTFFCLQEENKLFFKNVLLNINFKHDYPILVKHSNDQTKEQLAEFIKFIDKQKLNINHDEDIYDILNMIMMLTIHNLVKIVKDPDSCERNQKKYINQLKMLKQGIYK